MTAPTYHLHPMRGDVHKDDGLCPRVTGVPAVVLTASEEDVERAAIALAAAWKVDWDKLHGSSRDYYRVLVRGQIAALLTPPIPPEPTDLGVRLIDKHGCEWARTSLGMWMSSGEDPTSYADLWSERGPLREVE